MIRLLLRYISLFDLSTVLASCGKEVRPAVNVELLSTNVHVSVAQHTLVLPFIALADYAYRKQSFSLGEQWGSDSESIQNQVGVSVCNY